MTFTLISRNSHLLISDRRIFLILLNSFFQVVPLASQPAKVRTMETTSLARDAMSMPVVPMAFCMTTGRALLISFGMTT